MGCWKQCSLQTGSRSRNVDIIFVDLESHYRQEVDLALAALTPSTDRQDFVEFSAQLGSSTATQLYVDSESELEHLKLEKMNIIIIRKIIKYCEIIIIWSHYIDRHELFILFTEDTNTDRLVCDNVYYLQGNVSYQASKFKCQVFPS